MKGSVEVREVHSQALEGNPLKDPATRVTPVYLPPGYHGNKQRFPVVFFLHGFTGSGMSWINTSAFSLTVPQRVDRLIEQGKVPPFIGVFVDGWSAVGGSQWINSEAIGAYRDYVARDVVAWADAELRTIPRPSARAVVGKSSGGYGALVMGAHHADVFGAIGCHSGDAYFDYCYLPEFPKVAGVLQKSGGQEAWFRDLLRRAHETRMRGDDHTVINILAMAAAYSPRVGAPLNIELPFDSRTARIRPEVWDRWLQHDPVRFVPQQLASYKALKAVFVDCGVRDEFHLHWGARMVVEELKKGGVEVHHEEFEDGHMGINYRYDRSVSLLVPKLDRE